MSISEIVEQYERTWVGRDPGAMATCFVPGGTYNAPGADNITGTAIGEFADAFFTAFPDSTYEWSTVVCGADTAAVQWVFSGTMSGELVGIAPTGGRAAVRGAHIIRVADGKVASVESFWDNQDFFDQLGIKA
ncbi:MAG: ester cyclase [Sporichthyaceae bacterium]